MSLQQGPVDGTLLRTPDDETLSWRYPKRAGEGLEFGYPLLRLLTLVTVVVLGLPARIRKSFLRWVRLL